jgi:hypothetical protein
MKTAFQIIIATGAAGRAIPLTAEYSGPVLEFRTAAAAREYAENCFQTWRRKPAYHIVETVRVETVRCG